MSLREEEVEHTEFGPVILSLKGTHPRPQDHFVSRPNFVFITAHISSLTEIITGWLSTNIVAQYDC